ncbi:LOW QUALITY PROTEIN: hypothetical protein HID58_077093 [Brassica napus]|uniref:Uncharacterized protein n=1 Tax=Brassica napus TaxID=3708 RepID=A0ABQ7YSH7_BRANA|nr:LOW QUALITY PROTEIN: hypothetical protein HID58_077093 [Brassica napus]
MEKKIEHQQKEQLNSTNTDIKIDHQEQQISQASSSSSHMANLATSSDHHLHQLELAGNNINFSSIFDAPISLPFPYSYFEDHSSNNPNSFLDLLRQDQHQFASSSTPSSFSFDAFPLQNNNDTNLFFTDLPLPQAMTTKAESSEVVNTAPTSPNSTSVSSSSNEAANDNTNKEVAIKKKEIKKSTRPRYLLTQHHQPYNSMYNTSLNMINRSSSDGTFINPGSSSFPGFGYDHMPQASTPTTSAIRDHGLLQDILPSQIREDTINTQINEEDKK